MACKLGPLELKNPLVAASGCYGYGWEAEEFFPGLKWGAVTSKTVSFKPKAGNFPPRIFEAESGAINRIGLQNCGLKDFLQNEMPMIKKLPYPVIISIFGETLQEWKETAAAISDENPAAFELNLSCPNIEGERPVRMIDRTALLTEELKKTVSVPVIPKINAVDSPVELASALKDAGADAIVCSNSIPSACSLNGKIYHGGLVGPAIKPVVLKAVEKIAGAVEIDIAACGGITSVEDIKDYSLAGAKVFVLGSVLLTKPYIVNEFNEYLNGGLNVSDNQRS